MSFTARKPACSAVVCADAARGVLAFARSAASDGAVNVNIRHNGKATLQGRNNFGGSFRTIVFVRMQNREQYTSLTDGFICAI
jgi:hypothetical protein